MSIPAVMSLTLAALVGFMTLAWLLSLVRHDASVVDPFWGVGFIVAAVLYFVLTDGFSGRSMLVLALTCAWGVRLAGYIVWRNRGKGEDPRYRAMRAKRPESFWWYSYLQVFLLQALLLWLVAAPLAAAAGGSEPRRLVALDFVGLAVWLVGFSFEVAGDTHLALFKRRSENRGKVLESGVWKYTRHPNYFGETLLWWGVWLIAAAAHGYWAVYGPIVITLLLLRVSVVTLNEKRLKESKPGYADYVARTSSFVPWFPRRRA